MDSEFKIEDLKLVEQTKAGQVGAYDELYVRYNGGVLSMLTLRCGGDISLAKDLLQEAFIKAFVNIDKFDPRYTFGQWIHTIARNLFIDHTRRRRIEGEPVDTNTPCTMPDPEQRVIIKQNNSELKATIDRLPVHYRIIFELRYLQDLSYEQIAQQLELPMGTVKTHIFRAREQFLREMGVTHLSSTK